MKKTLLMLGAMALMSSSMFGAACLNNTTVAALIALNGSGGCDVAMNGDIITFSAFSGTGVFAGANANLDLALAIGQVGFQFVSPTGSFAASSGVLGYTATIKAGSCLSVCNINGVFEQAAFTPNSSTGTISFVESAGSPATLTGVSQTDGLSGTINVQQLVKTSMTYNGGATLTNFQSDIYTSTVPEPMTLSMMGIGLLGLGLMRRRQMGKK